jgi:RNA polymerase primary sigma factor
MELLLERVPRPGREEEREIAERALREDAHAIETLARANMAFVVHVAKKFRDRGVPLEDLVAEGSVGLMKAIRRFNPANGTRFTTYASFWIRKAIIDALLERPRVVHLPRYARERGRAFPREVSLDAPVPGTKAVTLGERLVDERGRPPIDVLAERQECRRLKRLVLDLSPREQAVLAQRFGLHGGATQTLHDIGASMGLSKERIRQIESGALSRLARRLRPRRPYGWS